MDRLVERERRFEGRWTLATTGRETTGRLSQFESAAHSCLQGEKPLVSADPLLPENA
jgi:hypothetical protein